MGKNFDDFRNGFQSLDFELLASKINNLEISSAIPTTEEGMKNFTTGVMVACITATFEILEAYHLWMSQPEKKS